ncbi:MAG: Uma2 family endonuclease [Bryobacteraceae bacterium]
MSSQPITFLTPDEYLEIEEKNEFRSEFVNGEVFAMAETTINHSWIVSNVQGRLWQQLRSRPCGVRTNEKRLYIARFEAFAYPDVVVTCGPDRLYKDGRTITDATLIVEVLSPSTKNYDRSEKFDFYRSLPSFAEYLLLAQDAMRAEHHTRLPDGSWLFREFTDPTVTIELKSIGCRLELQALYERVEFASEKPADAVS